MITDIAQFDQARAELVDLLEQLRPLYAWVSPLAEFDHATFRLGFDTPAEAERVARLVARVWVLRFDLCRVSVPGAVFRDPDLSDAAESFLTPGVVCRPCNAEGEPVEPSGELLRETRHVRMRILRELERRSSMSEGVFDAMLRRWADGGEAAARELAAEIDSEADDRPPGDLAECAIEVAAQDWHWHHIARGHVVIETWLERQGFSAAG
jgi:hypothetical protein